MKKRDTLFTFLLVGVFLVSFASAGWFSDTWNFLTGKVVSNNDLIAQYSFEDNYKDSVSGSELVKSGSVSFVEGYSGKAAGFNQGYLFLNGSLGSGKPRTYALMVKTSNPNENYKLMGTAALDSNGGWVLGSQYPEAWSGSWTPEGSVIGNCSADDSSRKSLFKSNEWTSIVVTYDDSAFKEYINGVLVKTCVSSKKDIGKGTRFEIGKVPFWGANFVGSIDEVKIFNRVLTETEIKALSDKVVVVQNSTNTTLCPAGYVPKTWGGCELVSNTTCTDSDGGVNYYIYGEVKQNNNQGGIDCCTNGDDVCTKEGLGNSISEKFCGSLGEVNYQVSSCPNGCKDGACVNATSTTNYFFPASVNVPVTLFKKDVQGIEYTLYVTAVQSDSKAIRGIVKEDYYSTEEDFLLNSSTGKFEYPNSDFAFKLLNVSDSGKEILLSSNYYACSNPVVLSEGATYSFTNSFGVNLSVILGFVGDGKTTVKVNGYVSNSLNEHGSFTDSNGNAFAVKDIMYSAKESTVSKVELCLPQGFVSPKSVSCEATTNFMKSPTDLTLESTNWRLNYQYSSDEDYSVDPNYHYYYASFSQSKDYSYSNVGVEETILGSVSDIETALQQATEYGMCEQQRVYSNDGTQNYQMIYVCKNVWEVGYNAQQIAKNTDQNTVTALWISGNKLFRVYSYNSYSQGCSTYEECVALDERQHREQQTQTVEFLSKLVNNEEKYVGGFYLDWETQQFVNYLLKDCKSDVEEKAYQGSWMCKQEPVICPPHGTQKETCTRWNSELSKYDTREATISCNPGICSGCYVARWIGSSQSTCVPYGFRISYEDGQDYNFVMDSYFRSELENEAGIIFDVDPTQSYLTISLAENNSLTRDGISISVNGREYSAGESDTFYASQGLDIVVNGGSWKEEYNLEIISLKYDSDRNKQEVELRFISKFPAYCDIDGRIKQQKSAQLGSEWVKCQNNYECSSNLCSDGECIELKAIASELKGFKGFLIKMLCRLSNPFSEDGYAQCLSDNI